MAETSLDDHKHTQFKLKLFAGVISMGAIALAVYYASFVHEQKSRFELPDFITRNPDGSWEIDWSRLPQFENGWPPNSPWPTPDNPIFPRSPNSEWPEPDNRLFPTNPLIGTADTTIEPDEDVLFQIRARLAMLQSKSLDSTHDFGEVQPTSESDFMLENLPWEWAVLGMLCTLFIGFAVYRTASAVCQFSNAKATDALQLQQLTTTAAVA